MNNQPNKVVLCYSKYLNQYDLKFFKRGHLLWFDFWKMDTKLRGNIQFVVKYILWLNTEHPEIEVIDHTVE